MTSDLAALILRTTLFASLAVIVLLLGRTPLRHWMGAAVAYQAWLIVPLATVAAMLPTRPAPVLVLSPALSKMQALAAQATPLATSKADVLLLVWMLGVAASLLWFLVAHRAFVRKAGRLIRSGDIHISHANVGPASVGLLSPRIIVPHDFAQRYTPLEQVLVISHERTHIARHDAAANLLAALFQCLLWFNPLIHAGVRCFRHDQELSCDALTLARHPGKRRSYAEALLKFHGGAVATPGGIDCHWHTDHPTKERLMNLQLTPPGTIRCLAGRCMIALLAAGAIGATLGARAGQAASAPSYAVAMTLDAGGERATPRIVTRAGEQFAVASGAWRYESTIRQADAPGQVWLAGKVIKDGQVVGTPTLLARLDEQATIRIGDKDDRFTLSMTVSTQR